MLNSVKLAMKLTTTAYDSEILELIEAGKADLKLAGIPVESVGTSDPLIRRAVTTYCRLNFGTPSDYDRLKRSYDEQKAQLQTAFSYLGGDE